MRTRLNVHAGCGCWRPPSSRCRRRRARSRPSRSSSPSSTPSATATRSAAGSPCGQVRDHRPGAPAPLQLTHTMLRFPKGAEVNGRTSEVQGRGTRAKGPRACPRGSKLGSGTARGAAPADRRRREREDHALQRRRRERQPDDDHLLGPGPRPDLTIEAVIRAGRRNPTDTCWTSTCRRSRRCRASPTRR